MFQTNSDGQSTSAAWAEVSGSPLMISTNDVRLWSYNYGEGQ